MSKEHLKNIKISVETVDNLIYSLEWIISSINFWKIDKEYPFNLILKFCADFYYKFRKLRSFNMNDSKTSKK